MAKPDVMQLCINVLFQHLWFRDVQAMPIAVPVQTARPDVIWLHVNASSLRIHKAFAAMLILMRARTATAHCLSITK